MNTGIPPAPGRFTAEQIEVDPILHFFHFDHLPEPLKQSSRPFCALADMLVTTLPRSAERTAALRKLLEAKDCAVRANVGQPASATLYRDGPTIATLAKERDELSDRLERLSQFLQLHSDGVSQDQLDLLRAQHIHMIHYHEVLKERLNLLQQGISAELKKAFKEKATELDKGETILPKPSDNDPFLEEGEIIFKKDDPDEPLPFS